MFAARCVSLSVGVSAEHRRRNTFGSRRDRETQVTTATLVNKTGDCGVVWSFELGGTGSLPPETAAV